MPKKPVKWGIKAFSLADRDQLYLTDQTANACGKP